MSQLSPQERDAFLALTQSSASTLNSPSEGVEDWKNHMVARGLAGGTIYLYTHTIKAFLALYPEPSVRDVRKYSVDRLQKVSAIKVRNDQKALRSFFNFLEAEGLWLDNPTKGLQLLKTPKVTRHAPEKEHVDKLLAAWPDNDYRLKQRLIILLLIDTGVRISEALSLQVRNIDFKQLEISVIGKGSKERTIPISTCTADLIREYMDKHPEVKPDGYLFPSKCKRGYQWRHNLEKTFRRICMKLDIPRITPHMLRHYFATHALRKGAKLEVISRILGHSSIAITADVYRTVRQDEIREEHKRFSPLSNV